MIDAAPVPECYVGLWRRRLLRDAQGVDTGTQVFWLQSGGLYADIRLPAHRAGVDGLARQQGFAGALEVSDATLTWRRWLDFQPPAGVADAGRMRFTRLDEMIEDGVHSDYQEIWERIGPASLDRAAFRLQVEYPQDGMPRRRAGVLVVVGEYFMFALDRLAALPAGATLTDLAQRSDLDEIQRAQLFACEISLGRRRGPHAWEITHSTQPGHEGRGLFEIHGIWTQRSTQQFEQSLPDGQGRRIWKQVECGARFHAL